MSENSLEIDFLAVGNGEKSGDAIAIRYGDFNDKQKQYTIVIDGGTIDSGKELIKLIKETYQTNYIDLVISTHPDGDHSSGLREILKDDEFTIAKLWMHRPWEHSEDVKDLFVDGRITSNSLSERLKEAYNYAYECEEIANDRGINIEEPFSGVSFDNGKIRVLGPDIEYYQELIPEFNKSPEAKSTLLEKAFSGLNAVVKMISETLQIETLDESGETSAENNSSTVLLLQFENDYYLFTGDTGVPALKKVLEYTEINGIDISNIRFMQVPHHGSRRNISPSILNSIKCKTAYVSASKDAPKHPSKKVINAFIRRDANVYTTEGSNLCHHRNSKSREGYSSSTPQTFFNQVEE